MFCEPHKAYTIEIKVFFSKATSEADICKLGMRDAFETKQMERGLLFNFIQWIYLHFNHEGHFSFYELIYCQLSAF